MDKKNLWQRRQTYSLGVSELGFELDYSLMNFSEDFLEINELKIARAFAEMKNLESGEQVNYTERRMVGHYWLRNECLAPSSEIETLISSTKKSVIDFSNKILSGQILATNGERFKNLLLIGIGGSALGPQLINQALASDHGLQTYFFDNTDPDGMLKVVADIDDIAATLVLVVSKSGGTPETYNGQHFVWNYFISKNLNPAGNFIAVTGSGSKLENLAKEKSWLKIFPMWDWVGGRTSIWSAVGLLPAALQGVDVELLLRGAAIMDEKTRIADAKQNPAMLMALMWGEATAWCGKKALVILPYKDRLALFANYMQQLMMESLGKEKNIRGEIVNQGILVLGNKGSTDQHSYVQQLREGLNNFFALFINVLEDSAASIPDELNFLNQKNTIGDYLHSFLLGTRQALFENGRESFTINIKKFSACELGALIALFERAVSFYASMVEVNAYDQPGVEAGKISAAQVLSLQEKILGTEGFANSSAEQVAAKLGEDDITLVHEILLYLKANSRK